jgi:hypothetical protein
MESENGAARANACPSGFRQFGESAGQGGADALGLARGHRREMWKEGMPGHLDAPEPHTQLHAMSIRNSSGPRTAQVLKKKPFETFSQDQAGIRDADAEVRRGQVSRFRR